MPDALETTPQMAPKPAEPQAIRLADYTAPDYLVDTVDLEFDLEPKETVVRARLALRRNPARPKGLALKDMTEGNMVHLTMPPAADGTPITRDLGLTYRPLAESIAAVSVELRARHCS